MADSVPGAQEALKKHQLPFVLLLLFFWPCHVAHGILVSQSGIESVVPVLGAQSLNHWTTREAPKEPIFMKNFKHTHERQYYNEFPSFNHHLLYYQHGFT